MRFVVSAALLDQLRQRRTEQRARRASSSSTPGPARGLLETMQQLFEHKDVNAAADAYVAGMAILQDEVEREHDAFLLDPGMGPMSYLTADGRVLLDLRSWDGDALREASDEEAIVTIVAGARKTGIAALLDLVPSKPPAGTTCARCAGTRYDRQLTKLVCLHCRGLGWEPAPAR